MQMLAMNLYTHYTEKARDMLNVENSSSLFIQIWSKFKTKNPCNCKTTWVANPNLLATTTRHFQVSLNLLQVIIDKSLGSGVDNHWGAMYRNKTLYGNDAHYFISQKTLGNFDLACTSQRLIDDDLEWPREWWNVTRTLQNSSKIW